MCAGNTDNTIVIGAGRERAQWERMGNLSADPFRPFVFTDADECREC